MKISVCMTTYNGSQYVEKQILSILPQLSDNDELVIVDDCSTDQTVDIIKKINDSRIKLFQNERNLGVIKNFEKSIKNSNGDIIFLSDQDDIWMPNKIKEIINIFMNEIDITLVTTDSEIIDENDVVTTDSFYQTRGDFVYGIIPHLIKPRFHGCTLAFKVEMLEIFLPFPRDIPMHDIWIGIVNEIYGKTFYIDKPLVKYRRHSNNVSPSKHKGIYSMIISRFLLIKNLVILIIRKSMENINDMN